MTRHYSRSHFNASGSGFSAKTSIPIPVIIGIVVLIKIACIACCCVRYCRKNRNNNNGAVLHQAQKLSDTVLYANQTQTYPAQVQTPLNPTQNYSVVNLAPSDYAVMFGNSNQNLDNFARPTYPPVYPLQPIGINPADNPSYPAVNTIEAIPVINSTTAESSNLTNATYTTVNPTCPNENPKYPTENQNFTRSVINPNLVATPTYSTHDTGINITYPTNFANTTYSTETQNLINPVTNPYPIAENSTLTDLVVTPTYSTNDGKNLTYPRNSIANTNPTETQNLTSPVINPFPTRNTFSNPDASLTSIVDIDKIQSVEETTNPGIQRNVIINSNHNEVVSIERTPVNLTVDIEDPINKKSNPTDTETNNVVNPPSSINVATNNQRGNFEPIAEETLNPDAHTS